LCLLGSQEGGCCGCKSPKQTEEVSGQRTCHHLFKAKYLAMSDLPMVQAIDDWEAEDEWQLTCYTDDIIYVLDKYEGNEEYEGV
jgi:hypothetical protein